MKDSVEVDIRLTVQDLFLVRMLQFVRKPWIPILIGGMMFLLLLIFVWSVIMRTPNYIALAEFCLLGFLVPVLLLWSTRRYYRSSKHIQEPMHYAITSRRIEMTSPSYASHLDLDNAWKIQETKEYFLIWESDVAAHVLPKRSFRNSEEVANVRSLLMHAHPVKGVDLQTT